MAEEFAEVGEGLFFALCFGEGVEEDGVVGEMGTGDEVVVGDALETQFAGELVAAFFAAGESDEEVGLLGALDGFWDLCEQGDEVDDLDVIELGTHELDNFGDQAALRAHAVAGHDGDFAFHVFT